MALRLTIFLLFFLSGTAGLIYEVVWAKYLALFLGNTAQAHTIVLATFMGGLALGYFLFGRIADRAENGLSLYGWMEIVIGFFGVLFVPLIGLLGSGYISLVSHFGLDSILAAVFKFLLVILLLLLPTTLMGGTLPVLSRYVVRSIGQVKRGVGWLYFLNSLGAAGGSLLAGFVLVPRFGLSLSITAAAILNLSIGLTALAIRSGQKSERERTTPETIPDESPVGLYTPWQVRIVIIGIALSGGAALIYEIAWIRLLTLVLGSSTYSFSLMLAAFITGIALGSFIVAQRWVERFEPYPLFVFAELGVVLSMIFTLPVYERLPFYFALLANLFVRAPETFLLYELTKFLVCFLLMLLPTLFLGMTLPLVSQVATRSLKRLGENIGNVFAVNTVGTLVGVIAAGLVLLPALGIKRLIEVGVFVNLFAGGLALWVGPQLKWQKKCWIFGTCLALFILYLYHIPAWDKNILSSGTYRGRTFYAGMSFAEFKRRVSDKILYYKDGANMTVSVTRAKGDHTISLRVNGKPDASTGGDLPTQILLGQIPLLLKPDAQTVLVIGLGSGITAGSVLRHPVERLDIVEISEEVVEGSRFFAQHNYEALKDPRLKLYIEDAKTFLKAIQRRYDIIVSEPSNPWIAGIGNLFTIEFYQDVKKRLQPDGLMVQWFHNYEMTDEILRLVLRSFTASFEHVTLWSPTVADLLLIGSKVPIPVDFEKSLTRFKDTKIKEDMSRIGIDSLATVLFLQVASGEGVRKAAGKGRINEDFFPILEYEAPKTFFLGQTSRFLISYDERRHPREGSSLYFTQYLQRNPLTGRESKDITNYYITYGSLPRSDSDLGRAFLDLWLQHDPNDPEAHWALARIESQRGNLKTARKEMEYILKLNPDNKEYLEAAADLEFRTYVKKRSLLNSRSPEKALNYLHRLLSLEDNKRDRIYRKIAQVYESERNFKSAIDYLEKAALHAQKNRGEFQPDALWLEAGNMAVKMEDFKTALEYFRKAVAHNPGNRLAKKRLRQLTRISEMGP